MKKTLFTVGRMLVSLGGLALILYLYRGQWPEILSQIVKANRFYFLLAVFIFLVVIWLTTCRLQFILKSQGISFHRSELFYLGLIGQFFNLFLPSSLGGDVVKAYYTYKRSGNKAASISSVFLDRAIGFFVVILIALSAYLFSAGEFGSLRIKSTLLIFVLAALLTLLFFLSARVASFVERVARRWLPGGIADGIIRIYQNVHRFQDFRSVVVKAFLLSILSQSVFVLMHFCLARSIDLKLPLLVFFVVIPLITIISMAPSINGLGVREASFIYFFRIFAPSEKALALALIYDALIYLSSFAFGILFAVFGGDRFRELKNEIESANMTAFSQN